MLTFVVVSVSLYSSIGATILMMEIIRSQKGHAKLCLDGYMSGLLSIGLLSEWPSVRWPFVRLAFCPLAFYRWPSVRWPFVRLAFCPGDPIISSELFDAFTAFAPLFSSLFDD